MLEWINAQENKVHTAVITLLYSLCCIIIKDKLDCPLFGFTASLSFNMTLGLSYCIMCFHFGQLLYFSQLKFDWMCHMKLKLTDGYIAAVLQSNHSYWVTGKKDKLDIWNHCSAIIWEVSVLLNNIYNNYNVFLIYFSQVDVLDGIICSLLS